MIVIRIELDGVMDKTAGKTVSAFVGEVTQGMGEHLPYVGVEEVDRGVRVVDGNPHNSIYVTDAWGQFEGQGGGPGVRGSVGYAVWMEDSQRFEVLSLTGPE